MYCIILLSCVIIPFLILYLISKMGGGYMFRVHVIILFPLHVSSSHCVRINTSTPASHLNPNGGRHILLVHRPHTTEIDRLIPCIQNGNHAAYPLQVSLEDIFQIITAVCTLFHNEPGDGINTVTSIVSHVIENLIYII